MGNKSTNKYFLLYKFVVQIKRDYEGQQGKELLSAQHHQLLNWLKNAETPCEI
jgi:hypothetical protein